MESAYLAVVFTSTMVTPGLYFVSIAGGKGQFLGTSFSLIFVDQKTAPGGGLSKVNSGRSCRFPGEARRL